MDLRDLAYFEMIADTQSYRVAADRLGRTKPALTKCVRRLEDAVGAALFERVGRGIRLTAIGELLLARAKAMRISMTEVHQELRDFRDGAVGHLRIGAGAIAAENLLPKACAALVDRNPRITLEIVIGMGDVLRTALRQGRLDVVVSSVSWREDADFVVHELGSDDVVVVAGAHHEFHRQPVGVEDLGRASWVLPAQSVANRQWLEQVFARHGLPGPNVQIETSSVQALIQLIAETNLLSFMSTRSLGPDRAGAGLVPVPVTATTLHRRLGLLHRAGGYLPPVAGYFIKLLRENAGQMLGPVPNSVLPRWDRDLVPGD